MRAIAGLSMGGAAATFTWAPMYSIAKQERSPPTLGRGVPTRRGPHSEPNTGEVERQTMRGTIDGTMSTTRRRKIAYWATTGFAAFGFTAIGLADLLRVPEVMQGLAHLGYPAYFATILGVWELLGSAAIVAQDLERVKEWAYAGMFFTLSGAVFSHVASGDPATKCVAPLLLLGAVVASSALRPAREARVGRPAPRGAHPTHIENCATRF